MEDFWAEMLKQKENCFRFMAEWEKERRVRLWAQERTIRRKWGSLFCLVKVIKSHTQARAHIHKLPHMTSHSTVNNKVLVRDWNKVGNSQQSQSTSKEMYRFTHSHTHKHTPLYTNSLDCAANTGTLWYLQKKMNSNNARRTVWVCRVYSAAPNDKY